jgi:seryl-tRNA synthetase
MIDDLSAEFLALGDGRLLLRGVAAALCRYFDDRFLRMAQDAGATECRFPAVVSEATLARAGYFEAFPDGATAVATGEPRCWLPPAVCYHAYEMLAGTELTQPTRLTAAQSCFREADRRAHTPGRLWEFTMREVMFLGHPEWVREERERWSGRIHGFARELGLAGMLEPAADPFFGAIGRGKRLLQQVKGLKYELRVDMADGALAVASFNLHETFFADRFAITLEGGTPAHSGCVAFGLERWALAFLHHRGAAAAEALVGS